MKVNRPGKALVVKLVSLMKDMDQVKRLLSDRLAS